jgi:hypothetical protein
MILSPANKQMLSGMAMLAGIVMFILGRDILPVSIIGGILFILGLNVFVDAKIEEAKEANENKEKTPLVKPATIRAEMHSDDHVHEVEFDAEDYFKEAADEDLHNLIGINFRGDYASDKVAEFFEESIPEIKECLEYCRHSNGNIGFECRVNKEDAMRWLWKNRPKILDDETDTEEEGAFKAK